MRHRKGGSKKILQMLLIPIDDLCRCNQPGLRGTSDFDGNQDASFTGVSAVSGVAQGAGPHGPAPGSGFGQPGIGRDILSREAELGWGAKVVDQISKDMRQAFPEMKGLHKTRRKQMSVVRDWYDALAKEEAELVRQLVAAEEPSDEQLEEATDLVEDYTIDAMGLDDSDREKLEAAVAELAKRLHQADPRHRFLRDNDDVALAPRLQQFYQSGEYQRYQHKQVEAAYAESLHVDFDGLAMLINPDFTGESIGEQYVEFADLKYSPDEAPGECYAHLTIDPQTTMVYLVEPSGEPELIADDLESFLAGLK